MSTAITPHSELPTAHATAVRFHLSLNVAELDRSVSFFRSLFDCEPAKLRHDYAKFEPHDLPLVLSLEPYKAAPGGNLNHLGFRLPDSEALVDLQRRLELAGISTRREDGVECCYARQTKFWVQDPDNNLWEIYTLHEDLEYRGNGSLPVLSAAEAAADGPPAAIWQHRLGDKFPARLPILDRTVDRVVLEGTFNERQPAQEQLRRLAEVKRVLKLDGVVHAHLLTTDRPLRDQPVQLPGPAARVEYVPEEAEITGLLEQAGFVQVATVFRGQSPCFVLGECGLRETRLEARAK